MITRRKSSGRLAALVLSAAALIAGCSRGGPAPGPPPAVPVVVASTQTKSLPVEVTSIGNVESFSSVSVLAQVGGPLTSVRFVQGQAVRAGQVLFTIDPRPYQATLAEATAALARDRVLAKNADADVVRYEDLAKKSKDYVTDQAMDKVKADADSVRQTVASDEAAVERARLDLEHCTITSPISGRAGDILVHAGNLIKANGDTPIVVILQTRPVFVTFAVPERYLPDIRSASSRHPLEVNAALASSPAQSHSGELSFVDNTVDMTTGTIQLKATFSNQDESLWPGQFVQVKVRLGIQEGALVVPMQAIQTGQQGSFVYVVKADRTVESRPVAVSRTIDGQAVVEKGLGPGESVVTDGQLRLVPGARVEIKPASGDNGGARS